jgi:hypothetical protein
MVRCSGRFPDSEMFRENARLNTSDTWPVSFISRNELAAAGFYFLFRYDGVRCPFCGVQLTDWEPGDCPRLCHRRRAPSCRFVSEDFRHNVYIESDDQEGVAVRITLSFRYA